MRALQVRIRLGRGLALAVGLAAVAGCTDEPDDLDPDVVNALSVTKGDAVGYDRSGDYLGVLEVTDCTGCDALLDLGFVSCDTAGGGGAFSAPVHLLETDGVLVLGYRDIATVGPIWDDGAFAVGSVADLSNAVADVHVVLRVDGTFDDDDDTLTRFTATVRQRTRGDAGTGDLVDCRETFELDATKL